MPIYAYRCDACGHAKDVLRKVSDALLTVCPACGAQAFQKQLTAAGFQLKGSGWYVTDFKGDANKKPAAGDKAGAAKAEASEGSAAKDDAAKGASSAPDANGAKADAAKPASVKTAEKSASPAPSSTPAGGGSATGS
jgi:putative FmdB family regulatory protein